MIQEDYCSYEIAKLLKERGFNEPCQAYWRDFENGDRVNTTFAPNENHNNAKGFTSMLTHQMAMKWLRWKNIIITPQPEYFSCDRYESWGIDIWAFGNYEKLPGDFPTYEEVVETALKYVLNNLL